MQAQAIKRYTTGEEIFNSVSHGISAVLAAIGCVVMVYISLKHGNTVAVISSLVFGLSLIMLYTMSTLYHAFQADNVKKVLRVFDHVSIPVLIAGSYTPFCLITLAGSKKGVIVACIVWACAVLAVILNAVALEKYEKLTLRLYIIMGWTALMAVGEIVRALPKGGFIMLVTGGVLYTVGVIFYKMKKVRYMHGVWHLFVSRGSLRHFVRVVGYVLPMTFVTVA